MLTLDQLIAEATVLPDADKTILIEKLIESMTEQLDQDLLLEGIQKAQERLAEIDNGTVQAIPGEIALAQIRQLIAYIPQVDK
jgi:Putative addiction module component